MAESKNYAAERKAAQQSLAAIMENQKRDCDHKPSNSGRIIPLRDTTVMIPGKNEMPDTTMFCQTCHAMFESTAYSPEELQSGLYMFQSMLHQIKLNAKLSDADKSDIINGFTSLDQLSGICTYYNDMVKKMSNGGNGGNKNRGGSSKGHMGMSRGLMGSRGF